MKDKEELWKPVVGWENYYEVSNHGNIRTKERVVKTGRGGYRTLRCIIIKKALNCSNGYYQVGLCANRVHKTVYVHRLVAEAFVVNSNNLPEVNHLDENKTNNHADNLEWCTRIENLHHGTRLKRLEIYAITHRNSVKNSKGVIQYDKLGNYISSYPSLHEAERITNIDQERISRVCRHVDARKTAGGYIWRFSNDTITKNVGIEYGQY